MFGLLSLPVRKGQYLQAVLTGYGIKKTSQYRTGCAEEEEVRKPSASQYQGEFVKTVCLGEVNTKAHRHIEDIIY